jgi:probable F420-dependent oxidoreductase
VDLGRVGVWWSGSWRTEDRGSREVAAEIEDLGYSALWSSGGFEPGISPRFERLLSSTRHAIVASGIVSIWHASPDEVVAGVADLEIRHPGRFLLGLGVSHGPLVATYARPFERMVRYLDDLDALERSVPKDRRVLAALGPRMLELAGNRATGAHPYFVPVEHTARARRWLGPGPLLAPEATVVLDDDPTEARRRARAFVGGYLGLPNYANNLRSLGFGDADQADGGSDRLIDAVVAWGDVDSITARVRAHREAGADHVCVQVVPASPGFPLEEYRRLAPALLSS